MLQTRIAKTHDAALVAHLSRKTFYDTFHEQNSAEDMNMFLESNFNDEVVLSEISDAENIFLIIEDNEVPIGYAKLSLKNKQYDTADSRCIEISRIYCIKEALGKGVGKALMQACIDKAISLNMQCLWLGVWEHNTRAIEFYKKFGFEKFSEHEFMLGNDLQNDWLMKKSIGDLNENEN